MFANHSIPAHAFKVKDGVACDLTVEDHRELQSWLDSLNGRGREMSISGDSQTEIERLQARCRELEASANEAQDARLRAVAELIEKQTMWRDWLTTYRDYVKGCEPTNPAEYLIDLLTEHLTHKIEAVTEDMTTNAGADLLARLQAAEAEQKRAEFALNSAVMLLKPFADAVEYNADEGRYFVAFMSASKEPYIAAFHFVETAKEVAALKE